MRRRVARFSVAIFSVKSVNYLTSEGLRNVSSTQKAGIRSRFPSLTTGISPALIILLMWLWLPRPIWTRSLTLYANFVMWLPLNLTAIDCQAYHTLSNKRYRTMKIDVSYEYEMPISYRLNEPEKDDWFISVAKNSQKVLKKFETLCLYEFYELHSEALSPDPQKTLKFVQRWGPLTNQPITRVTFTSAELILRKMLILKRDLPAVDLKTAFETGPLKRHFVEKILISFSEIGTELRPILKPKDLETAILLAGLLEGRNEYVRCHLFEKLGKPRDYDCPIGCWTRRKGRPGRKSRSWGDDRCRAFFNRNKIKFNWS